MFHGQKQTVWKEAMKLPGDLQNQLGTNTIGSVGLPEPQLVIRPNMKIAHSTVNIKKEVHISFIWNFSSAGYP
jgi:hypothetical protein